MKVTKSNIALSILLSLFLLFATKIPFAEEALASVDPDRLHIPQTGGTYPNAEPVGTTWAREFSENASGTDIVLTDGGYAVCGYVVNSEPVEPSYWTVLAEYDPDGNPVSSKTIMDSVRNRANSMVYDSTGDNVIITGYKYHEVDEGGHIYGDEWVWLMSVNGTLDRQWEEVYGEPFPDWGNSIVWDGTGYIIGGHHAVDLVTDGDGYLLRTNADRSLDWEATITGDNSTWWLSPQIYSVDMTSDNNLVLGTENGIARVVPGNPPVFQWRSGAGEYYAARETSDGGYIGVGRIEIDGLGGDNPYDMVITKLNSSGIVVWSSTYGRPGSPMMGATGMSDIGYDVIETGGGYLVTGYTESYGYHGNGDLLIARYDADGNMDWDITLGGDGFDEGRAIVEAPGGGYVVTGTHCSDGANRIWTVKVPGGYANPVADFTFSPPSPLFIEDTVTFNATASHDPDGSIVSYKWDFGDNTTGVGVSPTHRYYAPGTYNATLFVFDNEGLVGEYTESITAKEMETQWETLYGNGKDIGLDIVAAPDGGVVVAGYTIPGGTSYTNVWIFKTDSRGNVLWDKKFAGSYGYSDSARAVIAAHDGGYIIAGYREKAILPSDREIWFIKVAEDTGNFLWEKSYDYGTGDDEAYDIQWDGTGYIITGTATSKEHFYDVLLLKLDADGNEVWHEVYPDPGGTHTCGNAVMPTADGGYILTGSYTNNHDYVGPFLTIKVKSDHSEDWRTDTTGSTTASSGIWVDQTDDLGYIAAGTLGGDFALLKYTAGGTIDWSKTWGLGPTDYGNAAASFSTGGYIIVGSTYHQVGDNYYDDMYAVRTDASGNLLWDWGTETATPNENAQGVLTYPDGSCVMLGTRYNNPGSTWVFKLGPNTVPVADFGYAPLSPVSGTAVHFDASNSSDSDGSVSGYYWNFGNGDTDTGKIVDYAFPNPGIYNVKLTVVDDSGGVDSITESVTVASGLSVDFYANLEFGPVPLTVTFTPSITGGSGPFTYEWDLNGDSIIDSTDVAPIRVYNESGVYTVSLTVIDSLSDSDGKTKSNYITAVGIAAGDPAVTITTADVTDFPTLDPMYTDGAPPEIDWGSARGFNLAASAPDGTYAFRITFSTPVTPGFILYKLPDWTATPYTIINDYTIEITLTITGGTLDPPFVLSAGIPMPPTVTTLSATKVGASVVTLNGNLDSLGSVATANVSFEWGTSPNSYTGETAPSQMSTTGSFSFDLPGLSGNMTYYYRAKAVGDGIAYGNEKSFTTLISGCFIATAAYGSYLDPHLDILRDFRDSYLITNGPGRDFVNFYYENSPPIARFITDHPWLKPPIRAALVPVVQMAGIVLKLTPVGILAILGFLIVIAVLFVVRMRKRSF